MSEIRRCEACNAPLPAQKRGRPRRWCSDSCRARGGRARQRHDITVPGIAAEAAVEAVLASPSETQNLLDQLADKVASGALDGPEYNPLIVSIIALHRSVTARVHAVNQQR